MTTPVRCAVCSRCVSDAVGHLFHSCPDPLGAGCDCDQTVCADCCPECNPPPATVWCPLCGFHQLTGHATCSHCGWLFRAEESTVEVPS